MLEAPKRGERSRIGCGRLLRTIGLRSELTFAGRSFSILYSQQAEHMPSESYYLAVMRCDRDRHT